MTEIQMNGKKQIIDRPGLSEKVFAVCLLLYSGTAFLYFLKDTEEVQTGVATGSFVTNSIWIALYAISGYFLIRYRQDLAQMWRQMPLLSALTIFAALSFFWSDFRISSALHIGALLGTTVIGMYLGFRYDSKELLRLLGWSLGIAAVSSFLMSWLFPAYGIGTGQSDQAWIGVYPHKNSLGRQMMIAFLVFAVLGQCSKKWKSLMWGLCLLSLILIFLADDATAKVVCALLASTGLYHAFVLRKIDSRGWRFIIVTLLSAPAVYFLFLHNDGIFNALARDDSFTGRTLIWLTVWGLVQKRPLLGYGYGGFWVGLDGPSADIWDAMGTPYSQAHNGYLEIWANCGLVGLILFVLCLLAVIRKAYLRSSRKGGAETSWPFYLLLLLSVSNITEATFLALNQSHWLLFIAVGIQLYREGKNTQGGTQSSTYRRIEPQYGHT